jgi:hypothetical protein
MSASVTLLADAKTNAAATPTALSIAAAQNASNPMADLPGMLNLALLKTQELKNCLLQIKAVLDSSDPILTTINNDLLTLV